MSEPKFLLVALRGDPEVAAIEYGDFRRATGLADRQLDHLIVDSLDVKLPPLENYCGIFIGGSPFNVTDWDHCPLQKHSHDLLYEVLSSAIPSFFTCYGNGYVAFTCGGEVNRLYGEPAGTTEVRLTAAAETDPIFQHLPSAFTALTGHKESVAVLPENAVLLAEGPTCPHQIFRWGKNNWMTQFHPELDAEAILLRMSYYQNEGYFRSDQVAEIAQRVHQADTSAADSILKRFVHYCVSQLCPVA